MSPRDGRVIARGARYFSAENTAVAGGDKRKSQFHRLDKGWLRWTLTHRGWDGLRAAVRRYVAPHRTQGAFMPLSNLMAAVDTIPDSRVSADGLEELIDALCGLPRTGQQATVDGFSAKWERNEGTDRPGSSASKNSGDRVMDRTP